MNTTPAALPVDEIIGNPQVINYVADQVQESDMPRTAVEEYWDLYITGTLTNASYSAAPTSFVEAMLNLIYMVQVNASAATSGGVNEAFKVVDANYLAFIDYMYQQQWPDQNFGDYAIGTSNAAHPFTVTPRLYFTDPLSRLPNGWNTSKSTMLDTRLLSSLKFDIGFRDPSAMVYGGTGGTSTLSGVTVQVKALHYYGLPNVTSKGVPIVRNYLRETQASYNVVATGIDTQFQNLRVGAILHRMTLKGLVQPSGAPASVNFADPSDVLLQGNTTRAAGALLQLKVNNNAYTPLYTPTKQLQSGNVGTFGLTKGVVPGYEVYETSTSHNPRAMLNLRAATNMTLYADTDFTSGVQNNLQLTYVERVTPK
jgi:hypothetical protein